MRTHRPIVTTSRQEGVRATGRACLLVALTVLGHLAAAVAAPLMHTHEEDHAHVEGQVGHAHVPVEADHHTHGEHDADAHSHASDVPVGVLFTSDHLEGPATIPTGIALPGNPARLRPHLSTYPSPACAIAPDVAPGRAPVPGQARAFPSPRSLSTHDPCLYLTLTDLPPPLA